MISGAAVASAKLLDHGNNVCQRVFEKRLCIMVSVDGIQFGFMPDRGTIDVVFVL